jgi:hypothetical protein
MSDYTYSRTFTARRPDRCRACTLAIARGDSVLYRRHGRLSWLLHERCRDAAIDLDHDGTEPRPLFRSGESWAQDADASGFLMPTPADEYLGQRGAGPASAVMIRDLPDEDDKPPF